MSAGFDACNLNPSSLEFVGQSAPAPAKPLDEVLPTLNSGSDSEVSAELDDALIDADDAAETLVQVPTNLQRVAEARQQQGFSLRTISRRTGIDLRTLRSHEVPSTDMKLSELRAWQLALELPLVDLLEDDAQPLSSPVKDRANLVKIMKTVVAIKEAGGPPRVQRLASMLFEQMVELMPELKDVGGWPQHGSRRSGNSRIIEQQVNTQALGFERLD